MLVTHRAERNYRMDEDEELEAQQQNDEEEEEYYVISLHPVIMEDDIIHDGEHPCGEDDCPCATLGYPV
jgi:hypothetical protein